MLKYVICIKNNVLINCGGPAATVSLAVVGNVAVTLLQSYITSWQLLYIVASNVFVTFLIALTRNCSRTVTFQTNTVTDYK